MSFLSDYGTSDEFVGVVKSVIRDLARHVTVIDLTHDIAPHDVRAGSLALVRAIQYVPSGVVLAVVDPGVGTERRAIAVEVADGEGVLVGPDNGLLAPAVAMAGGAGRAVVLDEPRVPPRRRRGRRSPAATCSRRSPPTSATGSTWPSWARPSTRARSLPRIVPLPRDDGDELVAEVLWVDRFGNAQLNVGPDDVEGWGDRSCACASATRSAAAVGRRRRSATSAPAIGLVVDSYGLLAVSLDRRSAADELRPRPPATRCAWSRLDDDAPSTAGVTTAVAFPTARA